jgi:hypothetical protein
MFSSASSALRERGETERQPSANFATAGGNRGGEYSIPCFGTTANHYDRSDLDSVTPHINHILTSGSARFAQSASAYWRIPTPRQVQEILFGWCSAPCGYLSVTARPLEIVAGALNDTPKSDACRTCPPSPRRCRSRPRPSSECRR